MREQKGILYRMTNNLQLQNDLERLLSIMPQKVVSNLTTDGLQDVIEIVLDIGRPAEIRHAGGKIDKLGVEMITEDLVIIWGTCGAVIAFVAALFKAEVWVQLLLFTLATILFIVLLGPIVKKKRKKETIHTNADRLIGMTATVVEPFSNNEIGKVSINDQLWRATSMNNESFDVGEKVIIIAFSGAKLVISKTENENIIRL